jgi:hypothetical protein
MLFPGASGCSMRTMNATIVPIAQAQLTPTTSSASPRAGRQFARLAQRGMQRALLGTRRIGRAG